MRIKEIHTSYGKDWADKLVHPTIVAVVKEVIGQWEADKLVNGREQVTAEINKMIGDKLSGKPVRFSQLVIENIDFSDAFEKAIEAKQIATQEAIKAKNKTVQIEEESRQDVIRAEARAKATLAIAKAEAEAMEVRGKALRENHDLIMLQFVEKWDGTAPNTLILGEGANPLINTK
jgi:regulator of protease activity HflC (stomatin/prohibitin superfamily)